MSLLSEIQEVLERTYSPSGVDLEHCLIGSQRSRQLAALCPGAGDLAGPARTYLRTVGPDLRIAIYYHPSLIRCLEEEDPRQSISHRNVSALISFMEEITHGVHAALAFHAGWTRWDSEQFACALEAQARVDTFFLLVRFCRMIAGPARPAGTQEWILQRLFEDESEGGSRRIDKRYRSARQLARDFIEVVLPLAPRERIEQIRKFRHLSLYGKKRLVRRLSA